MKKTKALYAVELDVSWEAGRPDSWVIHEELDADNQPWLCVYETKKEALAAAQGRDHKARVVRFTRG
jgi:hypothetical protein